MNNLTNEQIVRVFLAYHMCELLVPNPTQNNQLSTAYLTGLTGVDGWFAEVQFHNGIHAEEEPTYISPCQCKLLLTPLSAITDEDAIEVAFMAGAAKGWGDPDNYAKIGRELLHDYIKSSRCNVRGIDWFSIFQYLVQKGYAVPLFIAPGHPDNGKTAIELGLAVDKTKEVQP